MAIEVVKAKPQPPKKFLIIGEPFTGKTTLAAKAPRPLFLSTDGNAAKAGLDAVNVKTKQDISETLGLFVKSKDYDTLVIDTIEGVVDIFKDDLLNEYRRLGMKSDGGVPLKSLSDLGWGKGTAALNEKVQAFSEAINSISKNIIILSYTKRQVDEATGSIVLSSEFKNIRLITRYMDAQVITTYDGDVYRAQLISKRETAAGTVDYSGIEEFLTAIGWELPKKKTKVGKVQGR